MTSSRVGRRQGRRQGLVCNCRAAGRAACGRRAVAVGQALAAEVARSRVRQAGERPPGISRLLPLGPGTRPGRAGAGAMPYRTLTAASAETSSWLYSLAWSIRHTLCLGRSAIRHHQRGLMLTAANRAKSLYLTRPAGRAWPGSGRRRCHINETCRTLLVTPRPGPGLRRTRTCWFAPHAASRTTVAGDGEAGQRGGVAGVCYDGDDRGERHDGQQGGTSASGSLPSCTHHPMPGGSSGSAGSRSLCPVKATSRCPCGSSPAAASRRVWPIRVRLAWVPSG
jgi:hypothetical protein